MALDGTHPGLYGFRMDTRATNAQVGRNVAAALTRTGDTTPTTTNIAGMTASTLRTRLNGETPFTITELAALAAATGTHPADFLAGAA